MQTGKLFVEAKEVCLGLFGRVTCRIPNRVNDIGTAIFGASAPVLGGAYVHRNFSSGTKWSP